MSPVEAHNALTMYLRDDYRFSKTFFVYGFLKPLNNATSEDGQVFFHYFLKGNGLLRITDIIRWSPVSTQAGSHPETLSFQRGILPLLRFFSSDLVVKSTLSHLVNGLYMCIMNNCDTFFEQIEKCMDDFIAARSFKDPNHQMKEPIGSQVLASLAGILFECLTRFKNSSATHPKLNDTVRRLKSWQDDWTTGISLSPPDFDDPFKDTSQVARDHITGYLKNQVERLVNIVDREQAKLKKVARQTRSVLHSCLCSNHDKGILSALNIIYDGPGENSRLGVPRHDNDFIYIEDIRIAPTHEELISTATPFLPANLHGAPHPHPDETMQRLLDIQFRLLREELTAPLRMSVQLIHEDFLRDKKMKSQLHEILKQHGGRYHGVIDTQETVMFNVYTGVEFISLIPDRCGLSVRLSFDTPPGRARSSQPRARQTFWEGMSGKRMMQGGLIALVWKHGDQVDVHLGTLASSVKEVTESVQANKDRVSARVVFFDPEIELRILGILKDGYIRHDDTIIMVESPVMFEAIRPFLDTLKLAEPETFPFSQYLVHRPLGYFPGAGVHPPRYTQTPGFAYQLAPLFPPEAGIDDLKLHVNDQESVAAVRHQLQKSRLDPSQAEAMVDALTREVALIQGPPGTGKSFTSIELLRVLVKTSTPILMIAFTNHALDHLLTGVLDAGITNKIVRLGSRSADEQIKKFSIEEIEHIAGRSRLDRTFAHSHRALKDIEKEIQKLLQEFSQTIVPSDVITDHLTIHHPEHSEHIQFPPSWISAIFDVSFTNEDTGWQTVGRNQASVGVHGCAQVPLVPDSDRSLDELLLEGDIWAFSTIERKKLHAYWEQQVREHIYHNNMEDFERLRAKYMHALQVYNQGKDEIRRQLLRNIDIIGCTTTGAAKLTSLLKGLGPRTMLVEEAGQVLEAHILGSLVPSVEHLILVGDPLQLRPTLNNYSLSMDSKFGRQLYKFDMSLMERLASSGFPMSQIGVQRRMRPAISNLIRQKTLYPNLIDHEIVTRYPDVRGFAKNVFFLSHSHRENGGAEESSSKYNEFETQAQMVKDLVLYLLRQGCYSQEGDIVVLCAYLGQLAHVRDALADLVAIVIDDRDKADLADQEADQEADSTDDTRVEHVKVTRRVRLRTVDNYQGEEAKIIILSLVRNAGSTEDKLPRQQSTIGFLKSDNRTNVALSRAKEGLFILGNAPQLASRSNMWHGVINELDQEQCIGEGFPIACHHHPDIINYASKPGQLQLIAPDGGCLKSCDARLKCGHKCPYKVHIQFLSSLLPSDLYRTKCHPDDPGHLAVACNQSCRRLCKRHHPCNKACAVPCGPCTFEVSNVELPCGHTSASLPCHLLDKLEEAFCNVIIVKNLPTCEHSVEMRCSDDPSLYKCIQPCAGIMECCGRTCNSNCYQCQAKNVSSAQDTSRILRTFHVNHPCRKVLHCAHICNGPCSRDHKCILICKEQCRQECAHAQCKEYCSTPCSPCQEPCIWKCPHFACPVPCGSVCARLPCDRRCETTLKCGHQCPSVCGEDCFIQICPRCAYEPQEYVVDVILGRTLADIAEYENSLDGLLITLPKCGHVFTVETLDGICEMTDYYTQNQDGSWIDLKTPVSETANGERKKPPVCPTCRSAITSPRYGRVYKSADLDILERNVIHCMSKQLGDIRDKIDVISKPDLEMKLALTASTIRAEAVTEAEAASVRKGCMKAQRSCLAEKLEIPLHTTSLDPGNKDLFIVSPNIAGAWRKTVEPLTRLYEYAINVAAMRPAHTKAWEASWSYLMEEELKNAVADPARAPRNLNQFAMQMARRKVGQPQPRADKRFVVEAFWATIQIRFSLAYLARSWLASASKNKNYGSAQLQMWALFTSFLLRGCRRDASIAYNIAEASETRRQMTTSQLLLMRVDLELHQLDYHLAQESGTIREQRQSLADKASVCAQKVDKDIQRVVEEHRKVLPKDAKDWLRQNFIDTALSILQEWEKLGKSIRMETFYQPMSLDEKMDVVKALSFTHEGHFYNCLNGHTFVITECGGAMEEAHCPECNEPIGGRNHSLNTTNTRATDFEMMARQVGAEPSPWAWGQ
ncbi:NFX1-type zinc finger-containing protein 1 [Termitomyces sp. J132]|nr:NFX1-type zinc finger-containing protein 1 [Termitomyces sp. J132]